MRLIWIVIVALMPMFTDQMFTVRAQERVSDYKIDSLKAMLFYDNRGTFSADVAQEDVGPFLVPSMLWNSPMEGASREGAATSMLVTIEVSGEFAYTAPRRIQFTAAYVPLEGRRSLFVRRSAPIWIRENGKYVAGFWLYQVGCNPVSLSARITGQRSSQPFKRVVRFGCGE